MEAYFHVAPIGEWNDRLQNEGQNVLAALHAFCTFSNDHCAPWLDLLNQVIRSSSPIFRILRSRWSATQQKSTPLDP